MLMSISIFFLLATQHMYRAYKDRKKLTTTHNLTNNAEHKLHKHLKTVATQVYCTH